jgi:peptide/nickel transport system substrate-binding protein
MLGNRTRIVAIGGAAVLLLSLAACGSNRDDSGGGTGSSSSKSFTMGTTDTVTAIDPAGSYDLGPSTLQYSIFQNLLTIPAGQTTPVGDAAQSCTYSDPSADVEYSFQRALAIGDPNGAAIYLLGDIAQTNKAGDVTGLAKGAIDTPDATTVVFHLNKPDVTFQYILTYPGTGAIVDQQVFPADKKLADDKVIGSGPYKLSQYKAGQQAVLQTNSNYSGDRAGKAPEVFISYYQDATDLKLAVQSGEIDVAWDTLGPTDITALKSDSNVTVSQGAGAAIRYWVWNNANGPGKELAVRKAAAQLIDRTAIAKNAYDNTVTPMYSIVPPGLPGMTESFKAAYGASPDVAAAKKTLSDAGIKTPVAITMGYTPTHYGPNTVDEATEYSRELESSGLFKVSLKSAEWTQYQTIYKQGAYDLWILGWYPDYLDTDDYLSPFLVDGGFFQNGYKSAQADNLVGQEQGSTNTATRLAAFKKLQDLAAKDVPFIPTWVGNNTAVYGAGMSGVKETLDPAYIFRLWTISKS